nr:RNA methyltransferase [Litorivivens lipolytica]
MLTVYGRKPVLEALQDENLPAYRLHLADSNRKDGIIRDIQALADKRNIETQFHSREALARISRNGKQDQGVALDLQLPGYRDIKTLSEPLPGDCRLLALDRITNPQNLGMIVRSIAASGITGLLLPKTGCASLGPLVIKASAGTLFKAPIYHCQELPDTLSTLKARGCRVATLSSHASHSLLEWQPEGPTVYVLGNETEGVSRKVSQLSDVSLAIPMHNGVESLNVAVTAALIAFKH